MPNFDAHLEPTYSTIHLIYESDPAPVSKIEVFFNNESLLEIANPVFKLTLTSVGNKWIYAVTPSSLGLSEFLDGLYHFVIYGSPQDLSPNGVIVARGIYCCMAKALTNIIGDCNDCSSTAEQDRGKIGEVNALLMGADAALRSGNIDLTMCALNAIDVLCEECGCDD